MRSTVFHWTPKRQQAAELLAAGHRIADVARILGISERVIYKWKKSPDFLSEIDHLTLTTHLAQKAERLRFAYRMVADKAQKESRKDLLDWLEYIRNELEGSKHELDIGSALTAILERLADGGGDQDADAG
jgi:transposase-like protein